MVNKPKLSNRFNNNQKENSCKYVFLNYLSFLGEQANLTTYSMVKNTAVNASIHTITSTAKFASWCPSRVVPFPAGCTVVVAAVVVRWSSSPMPPTAPWNSGVVLHWHIISQVIVVEMWGKKRKRKIRMFYKQQLKSMCKGCCCNVVAWWWN